MTATAKPTSSSAAMPPARQTCLRRTAPRPAAAGPPSAPPQPCPRRLRPSRRATRCCSAARPGPPPAPPCPGTATAAPRAGNDGVPGGLVRGPEHGQLVPQRSHLGLGCVLLGQETAELRGVAARETEAGEAELRRRSCGGQARLQLAGGNRAVAPHTMR
jgi:hypothetical protein